MLYFDVWMFCNILISLNLKISFMSLGDQPILTLRISVTNFLQISIVSDFDIKILHLG